MAYRPATSDHYEKELPNDVSFEAFDLNELLETLRGVINGETHLKTPEREMLIQRNLAGIAGAFASERILYVIEDLDEQIQLRRPGIAQYLRGRYRASSRARAKLRNANVPGHKNNSEYQRHRFPGIALSEVQERIARFGKLLGRFDAVRTSQVSENIFQIYPD